MTVNSINGSLLSVFSAVDGVALSSLSEINGQALASAPALGYTTGLWALFDAALGVYENAGTDAAENGDLVQQWNDQSGNARHATQANATFRPVYNSSGGPNGEPYLRWAQGSAGTGDWVAPPSMAALTAGEIFVVLKVQSDPGLTSQSGLWIMNAAGTNTHYPFTDANIYDCFGSTSSHNWNPSQNLTQWHLYNVSTEAANWTARINGTSEFTTGANTVSFSSAPHIGSRTNNVSNGPDIALLLIYDHVLTGGNRDIVESYIAARFGLTIS